MAEHGRPEELAEFAESLEHITHLLSDTSRYELDDEMRTALISVLTPILKRRISEAGIDQIS